MRLTTLFKTLSGPDASSSPLRNITVFTLDLSVSEDPADFISRGSEAVTQLRQLTSLRYVAPRNGHAAFPRIMSEALVESGCRLTSLGLSRCSRIEGVRAFDEVLGATLSEFKLNECDAPVWSVLLLCVRHPKNIEGLHPPTGLDWLSATQWESLRSLRLGHGRATVIEDLLDSIDEQVGGDPRRPVEPELGSLVFSHFEPFELPLVIRIARAFGSPSVRKLELSSIAHHAFGPRLVENLGCYFECLEDLRIHSAPPLDAVGTTAVSKSGRQRIPPVDWTQDARFDIPTFAEAFATFRRLRTLEINHATLPNLIPLTRSMVSHAHPGSTTTGPDLIADQMIATVRIIALKCQRLRRCGFSFSLANHYLDVVIDRHRTNGTTLVEHWSRAAGAAGAMNGVHPAAASA